MAVAVSDLKSKVWSVVGRRYGFNPVSGKKVIQVNNSTATVKVGGDEGKRILKVYSPVFLQNFEVVTDFSKMIELRDRELEILSMLNHPNLPHLEDKFSFLLNDELGNEFENIVACMNFFEAKNLRTLIDDKRLLSETDSLVVLKDVLSALAYLQSDSRKAVVHRDIKPENVLFDSNNAFLIDFNFSSFLDSKQVITQHGSTMLWSFGYYPAEFYKQEQNLSMDLFALGRVVVSGMYGTDIMNICKGDFDAKLDLGPLRVSDNLKSFLEILTEPKIEKRFESATQALDVLDNLDKINLWNRRFSFSKLFRGSGKSSEQVKLEIALEEAKLKEAEEKLGELKGLLAGKNAQVDLVNSELSEKTHIWETGLNELESLKVKSEKVNLEVAAAVSIVSKAQKEYNYFSEAVPETQQKLSEIKKQAALVLGDKSLIKVASKLPSIDELNKFDSVEDISSLLRLLESDKSNLLNNVKDVDKYIGQLNACARKLGHASFSLPANFDVSKIVFTPYYSYDGVRAAFEQRRHSQRKTILLSLPLIALFRGLDESFSSALWKVSGDWMYYTAVSEWLAMPAKNSKGSAKVVVSHGLNGYFFADSSRMPNSEIGVLSKESFDKMFESAVSLEDFRRNGIDLFSPSSIRLEGRDAEAFLKLRDRYSLKDLKESPIDILLGNKQILEKYFETAKNTDYNKNQNDGKIGVYINYNEPASGACGRVAFLYCDGLRGSDFIGGGRFVGVALEFERPSFQLGSPCVIENPVRIHH